MAAERFEDRVHDRLAALGEVTSRPRFGGHGLYWRETIFGIVFGDRLYLKVDGRSKADFVSRGMGPFRPNERQTLKSYFEVPPEVLADPDALLSWVKEAMPLSEKDQDDRIRMALGLTHDNPLPDVSRKTLVAYHRYLKDRLRLPFPATTWDFGRLHDQLISVTIHGLLAPEEVGLDKENGLICTGLDQEGPIEIPLAEIEIKKKVPNSKLVSDDSYWFHNWR